MKKKLSKKINKEKNMKTKIKLELERVGGKTYFKFQVDKSLEQIFEGKAKKIKTSQSWLARSGEGLSFYYIPEMTTNQDYKDLLYKHKLIDDYGTRAIYDNLNGHFNIAFVRTVGGKGEIEVPTDIPFAVVSTGMKNIVAFLKEYYEEYLRDYKVRGLVNFEV